MEASRHEKRPKHGKRDERNKRIDPHQAIANALGYGPLSSSTFGINRPNQLPPSATASFQVVPPKKEEKAEAEDQEPDIQKRIFADFVYHFEYYWSISFTMMEKNGYTESSFKKAFLENYNVNNQRMRNIKALSDLFDEMYEQGDYKNIQNYIREQLKLNTKGLTYLTTQDLDVAYALHEEVRLNMEVNGTQTDNQKLKNLIQDDVNLISDKLVNFFLNQECVAQWNTTEVLNLIILANICFEDTFHQLFKDEGEKLSPDADSNNAFSTAAISILCNVLSALPGLKIPENEAAFKRLLNVYKTKKILDYKGKDFDDESKVYNSLDRIKFSASIISDCMDFFEERRKIVSKIDQLRSIKWFQNQPFEVDKTKLSIPKGCFLIDMGSDDLNNSFALFIDGKTGDIEFFFQDEEGEKNRVSLGYCPSTNNYRLFSLSDSCRSFLISSSDNASCCNFDRYVASERHILFQEVANIGVTLKYTSLQLIANIEKIFPHIFDESYKMDPIYIGIDCDSSKLEIKASRSFLDTNLDNLKVVGDAVYSKHNELFEGSIEILDDVEAPFAPIDIKFIDSDPNDLIKIDTVSDVVLQFPLSIFIDGKPISKKEEITEEQKADNEYWKKIDDYYRSGKKNRFTYDEFIDLLSHLGEVIVKKGGGKGSHYKLFIDDDSGSFATVSKRKRCDGLYLIDLKNVISDLNLKYEDFYNKVIIGNN